MFNKKKEIKKSTEGYNEITIAKTYEVTKVMKVKSTISEEQAMAFAKEASSEIDRVLNNICDDVVVKSDKIFPNIKNTDNNKKN
jgi:NCAIR mutase (PurE)-related protein